MKCNMSPLDAGIRSGLGLALLASPLLNLNTYPANWLGLVLIATGIASYCPLYSLLRAVVPASRESTTGRHATSRG